MSMPFGIIFSIILIVVFIIIAFIAVNHFLSIGDCSKVGQFYSDLQKEVNNVWNSQQANTTFKIDLPSGTEMICFANMTGTITNKEKYDEFGSHIPEHTIVILPDANSCNMPSYELVHINLAEITKDKNPYCVDVSRSLILEKDFYDKYVTIR